MKKARYLLGSGPFNRLLGLTGGWIEKTATGRANHRSSTTSKFLGTPEYF
jgi:hypothetical protein